MCFLICVAYIPLSLPLSEVTHSHQTATTLLLFFSFLSQRRNEVESSAPVGKESYIKTKQLAKFLSRRLVKCLSNSTMLRSFPTLLSITTVFELLFSGTPPYHHHWLAHVQSNCYLKTPLLPPQRKIGKKPGVLDRLPYQGFQTFF